MKKSDLRNGAIVETRDGDKSILLFDCIYCNKSDISLISLTNGTWLSFSMYNDDLTYCYDSDFDIIKVAQSEYVGDDIRNHVLKRNENDWTWIRDEEKSKYFTGKVVCIDCRNDFLTKGKIYEFKDGFSIDDENDVFPFSNDRVTDIDNLNKRMRSEFIEIKE